MCFDYIYPSHSHQLYLDPTTTSPFQHNECPFHNPLSLIGAVPMHMGVGATNWSIGNLPGATSLKQMHFILVAFN